MSFSSSVNSGMNMVKAYWQKVDLQKWSHDIGGSSAEAVLAAMYFLLSFGVGFFLKKYFKFLFGCLVGSALLILILQYMGIIHIDWNVLRAFLGIGPTGSVDTLMNNFFTWVKKNVLVFTAMVVGFLVGYKLG